MNRSFEDWSKLDSEDFWMKNPDEWKKACEDGFFVQRHDVFLKNRKFAAITLKNTIVPSSLKEGIPAFELFKELELCASSNEVRRLVKQKGLKVNNKPLRSFDQMISTNDAVDGIIILSRGKKKKIRIKI